MSVQSLRVSVTHFRLLKWEASTFILSGRWLHHPKLNPLNCKICIKIQQRVSLSLGEIHNVNWPTLWYGWHGFEHYIIDNATNEWCKRLWMCSCKRTTFLVFNLTKGFTFVNFNVLVDENCKWVDVIVLNISYFHHFWFFTFYKVGWLHSYGVVGKITDMLLQIPYWIQW